MDIILASDHGGFELKEFIKKGLENDNKVKDLGCGSEESCDYPDFAEKVAKEVADDKESVGILCCGTGIGMSIAANKVAGIRAAVIWDEFSAKAAKEHNNANVICLGGRVLEKGDALNLVKIFLNSTFHGEKKEGERHKHRVEKIDSIEVGFPEPVVGALIFNEKNEIFLMKSPKWNDLYSVPGGHIEKGETRLDALRREVKEETGMEIHDEKLFTLHDAIFPTKFHKRKHFVMIDYLAKAKDTKVTLDKREGTEFKWMKPNLALKELKLNDYTKRALEDYVKIMDLSRVL